MDGLAKRVRHGRRLKLKTPLVWASQPASDPGTLGIVVGRESVAVPTETALTVGNGEWAHLRISDPHVSAAHCEVNRVVGGLEVIDLGSTNGIWFRGNRVDRVRVQAGDVVFLGRVPMLIVICRYSRRYPDAFRWQGLSVRDPLMVKQCLAIARVSAHDVSALIQGESGVGKEEAAQAIHRASARAQGPWVALNCAALPESLVESELFGVVKGAYTGADRTRDGAFERAHQGTLFLDEIGDLPANTQGKLLRVLEDGWIRKIGAERGRKVDVRVVAATWRNLEDPESKFRWDLLQRLSAFRVELPPLRHRVLDIGPLLEAFLSKQRYRMDWPDEPLMARIEDAFWPGNVRQLANRVFRASCFGDSSHLTSENDPHRTDYLPRKGKVPDVECLGTVRSALDARRGNLSAAARDLGVSRSTLYRWLGRSG